MRRVMFLFKNALLSFHIFYLLLYALFKVSNYETDFIISFAFIFI